ncbi:MAG: HupE/UreJ family protein [Planctomycetes bacterium]|nr:HupE/UreJ family protein [Planctomycetota bacterium]
MISPPSIRRRLPRRPTGHIPPRVNRAVAALTPLVTPALCFAHEENGAGGFVAGLTHPVFGWDHLLAMVSVGVVSAQLGGRSIWTVPSMFVAAMVVGGTLGMCGVPMPYAELGIAISVVVLGLSIALVSRATRPWLVLCFVAFFGSFHGHAHGVEIPRSASPLLYTMGFVLSTATLHILGVLIGEVAIRGVKLKAAPSKAGSLALRAGGAAVAIAGLVILGRWVEWMVRVGGV